MSFQPGEGHPSAKLTEKAVIRLRRRARTQKDGRGWITAEAERYGVSDVAILNAISGESWAYLNEPTTGAGDRHHWFKPGHGSRRYCPTCDHPKYYRRNCKDKFHTVDHRRETSAANARKANRASVLAAKKRRAQLAKLTKLAEASPG